MTDTAMDMPGLPGIPLASPRDGLAIGDDVIGDCAISTVSDDDDGQGELSFVDAMHPPGYN